MRIKRFFEHQCTLVNPGDVIDQDPYGRDIYSDDDIQEEVPCRVDQIRKRATQDEYGTDYVTQNMVFMAPETNVTNNSRIRDLVDGEGNPIITGEYKVQNVIPVYRRKRKHHYEVSLIEG